MTGSILRPLGRPLVVGCTLGWFALELLRARMVLPQRTVRCFQLLWMFVQAEGCARQVLAPLLTGTGPRQRELRRYARNCIVLVALQPEQHHPRIRLRTDWVLPAALFGACIPLFDGCFDQLPTRRAQAFARDVTQALAAARDGHGVDLQPLAPTLGNHGASAADQASWQALIGDLNRWLAHQPAAQTARILDWMARMNEAQLASLSERNVTLSLGERRRLSCLKGGVSFLLLRCLCLRPEQAPTGADARSRAALLQAAAVAQWIDDYADVQEDLSRGIHTFIARQEATGLAEATIAQGLRDTAASLRALHGQRAERFINSLSLYFAIKRSGLVGRRVARALGLTASPATPA